jgi:CBS domain containing-hemolysin-like protein
MDETAKSAAEAVKREPDDAASADEVEDGPSPGLLSRLFGFLAKPAANGDLAEAIETGDEEAVKRLPPARRDMIERVIAFYEKRVFDVMAPRADIVAVDQMISLNDLVRAFSKGGHSRMPVYRADLDDPVGMVHIKDVVDLIADPAAARAIQGPILKTIRRDILYVPPSMRVTDLLLKMQASRIHMALVVDEYGGTDGLVTIEDLVEVVVGDINDEHDEDDAPRIAARPGGGWDADARVDLAEFAEKTGVELVAEYDEADTLGGLVFSLAGRVPQRGEVLSHESGYDFEVTEADVRKVRKIRIRPRKPAEPRPEPPV